MIRRLKKFFTRTTRSAPEDSATDTIQLAVAVLLVEIARADHQQQESEDSEISSQLADNFQLSADEARSLLNAAKDRVEHSVSLQEFTRRLHTDLSDGQKQKVIEMLWRVALADNDLDKYEDYLIGKIAELLYVSRGDVIRLRHHVSEIDPSVGGS
jgi:uncharacterized tellurite resistance protein B-like protein